MSLAEPGEPFEPFVTASSRPALGYYVSASGSEEEEGTEYVSTPRYPPYDRQDNLTRQYMEERQNFPRQLPPIQLSPRSPSTSSISAATISSSPSPTQQITGVPFRLYSSPNSPRDFISLQSSRESAISLPSISDSPFIPDSYTTNQSVSSMLRYPPMNHSSNHLSYPPTQNNPSSVSNFSSSSTTAAGSSSTTSNNSNNTNEQPKQSPLRFGYPDSQEDDDEEELLLSSSTTPYDMSSRKRVRTRSNDWANNGTSNRNSSQIYHQLHHPLQFGSFAPVSRDLHHSNNGNRSSSSIVSSQSSTQIPPPVPPQVGLHPSSLQRPPVRQYIDLTSPESSPTVPSFNSSYSSTSRNTSFVPSFPLGTTPSQLSTGSNPTSTTTNTSNNMSTSSGSASSFPLPPLQRMPPRSSAPFTAFRTRYTSSFTQTSAESGREFSYGGSETQQQQERNQTTGHVPRLRSTPRWTPRSNELSRADRETLMRAMNATVQRRLNRTSSNGNNNHQSSYGINSLQDSALRGFLSDEEHDVPIEVPDSPEREINNNLSDSQWGRPMRRITQEFTRERHSSNFIRSQAIAAAAAAVNETTAEGTTTTSSRSHHSGDRGSFTDAELARRMQAQEYSVMQSQSILDNMNSLARIIGENGPGPRPSVSSRHSSRRESSSTTSSPARSNSATRERSFRFQSRLAELFTHDHRHHEERSNERKDLLDMLPDVIGNGIMSNPDNYLDDDDFDPSYENLIRLCERNGDVKPKCAPEDAINNLPTKLYAGGKGKTYEERCSICLTEYEENEKLMSLPCSHDFHHECVVNWLKKHSSNCPICRQQITKAED
ncbi:2464_t:CDS:2 [Ambispora gerdemannii]|uniref:2464_t:CDS:1 n=1 Tax=Ambispora gerdemannii TaxID=144530 RepID=A0A9N8YRI7_9GLOM|nr:2464_t:CDS:2 [Ambispora gerdemannii]